MVNFYIQRIKNELMKLEEVPALWRAKVAAELEKEPVENKVKE